MPDTMLSFVTWLGHTPISIAIKSSAWMFPAGETVHFVGLFLWAGVMFWGRMLPFRGTAF